MQGMESAVATIREALDERVSTRERLMEQVRELDAHIKRLTKAESVLSDTPRAPVRRPSGGSGDNIAAVEAVMRRLGTATQQEVAKAIGKPKNTAKGALEVLAERGVVAPTGEFDRRSPKFRLVHGDVD